MKPREHVFTLHLHDKGEEIHVRASSIDAVGIYHQPLAPGIGGTLGTTGDRIRGMYLIINGRQFRWDALGADGPTARRFAQSVVAKWTGKKVAKEPRTRKVGKPKGVRKAK